MTVLPVVMDVPPLWMQNLAYPAEVDRMLIGAQLETGAIGSASLAVGPRSGGATMAVDVAAGTYAIAGPLETYLCESTAVVEVPIDAAPASGSRIDIVYAQVRDAQAIGVPGGDNDWVLDVAKGTPAGTNPTPPTNLLPSYSSALARVEVVAGAAAIQSNRITDVRPSAEDSTRWDWRPRAGRWGQLLRGNEVPLVFNRYRGDWVRLQPANYDQANEKGESIATSTYAAVDPGVSWRTITLNPMWSGRTTITVMAHGTFQSQNAAGPAAGGLVLGISFNNGGTYNYSQPTWATSRVMSEPNTVSACHTVDGTATPGTLIRAEARIRYGVNLGNNCLWTALSWNIRATIAELPNPATGPVP